MGPYVLNPDCTGTLSQSDSSNYDFVVIPDGSWFSWIETDAGTVLSGEAVRFTNEQTGSALEISIFEEWEGGVFRLEDAT